MSRILNQLSQLPQIGQLFRSSTAGAVTKFQQNPYAKMGQSNPFQSSNEENPFRQLPYGENLPFEKPRFLAYHNNRTIHVGSRLNISC